MDMEYLIMGQFHRMHQLDIKADYRLNVKHYTREFTAAFALSKIRTIASLTFQ